MKMNNATIIQLMNLLQKYKDSKLPQKISYAIGRNLIVFENEYKFYQNQLNSVLEKYNDDILKDENGEMLTKNGIPVVKKESEQDFYKELNDLLSIDVEVNLYTVDEESFNYDDNSGRYDVLSPSNVAELSSVLCFEQNVTINDED